MKYTLEKENNKNTINVEISQEELKLSKEEFAILKTEARWCYEQFLNNEAKKYKMELDANNEKHKISLNMKEKQSTAMVEKISEMFLDQFKSVTDIYQINDK